MLERTAEEAAIEIAGTALVVDPLGALWWPAERLLVVADLHLEKGSSFAARQRGLVPPYDTGDTLRRLSLLLTQHEPRRVVALGDSFHDGRAMGRMDPADTAMLGTLAEGRDWLWLAGNHDRDRPAGLPGDWLADELEIGPLTFRHEPTVGPTLGELAGHLHPVAKIRMRGRGVRRRCVATDGRRAVLPAFGAYAGGLNLCDPAFVPLFQGAPVALMLGAERVYRIPGDRLLPDGA
ncbi:MAG TPA: ligase-associated DNA damage response endonuclease PdeM [Hyphomicrobiales bacterium]|nr:ligase-associated DNA damage response endonuclease PdeM [Hyphomicrobiales bacterium]